VGWNVSANGTLASAVGAKNPYRYRGYRYDTETGLYYLQSRYYNPEWGRFLNADAIAGAVGELLGANVYAYTGNNPVSMSDPNGFRPEAQPGVPLGEAMSRAAEAEQLRDAYDYEGAVRRVLNERSTHNAASWGSTMAGWVGTAWTTFFADNKVAKSASPHLSVAATVFTFALSEVPVLLDPTTTPKQKAGLTFTNALGTVVGVGMGLMLAGAGVAFWPALAVTVLTTYWIYRVQVYVEDKYVCGQRDATLTAY
jgi:RHS repeat-associated protein